MSLLSAPQPVHVDFSTRSAAITKLLVTGATNEHPEVMLAHTESSSRALHQLQEIADSTRRTFKALIEPKHPAKRRPTTIHTLPTEILSLILELVVGSGEVERNGMLLAKREARQTTKIQLVCRRFRAVAIATPRLWMDIVSRQPQNVVEQRISRSRGHCLNILVSWKPRLLTYTYDPLSSPMLFSAFMRSVTPLSLRWRSFVLEDAASVRERDPLDSALDVLYSVTMNLQLPLLRHIYLDLTGWKSEFADEAHLEFYNSWSTPVLASFHVNGCLPARGFGLSVTRGVISHQDSPAQPMLDPKEIVAFLHMHTNLEEVQLIYSEGLRNDSEDDDSDEDEDSGFELTTLSSIRRLSIETYAEDESAPRFMELLDLPALEELTLKLPQSDNSADEIENTHRLLSNCLLVASNWPLLEKLYVKIMRWDSDYFGMESTMQIILEHLGDLKHLRLEDMNGKPPDPKQDTSHLQTLTLENCLNYDKDFLERTVKKWKKAGTMDRVEKFSVSGFTKITREHMKRLLPSNKFVWKGSVGSSD